VELLAKDRRQLGPTIPICSRAQASLIPQPKIVPISLVAWATELKSCTVTLQTFSRYFFISVYAFHIATHGIFQGTGAMQSTSVSQEQYTGTAGERSIAQRPKDSNVLKGQGAFDDTTQHRADYVGGVGERYETVRRGASDVLKGTGEFDGTTQNRLDYVGGVGDRAVATRPTDSDVLKGTGAFDDTTQNRADFTGGVGERYETVRRGASDVLKVRAFTCIKLLHMSIHGLFTGYWSNGIDNCVQRAVCGSCRGALNRTTPQRFRCTEGARRFR
jgi:hypothetical protein